MLVPMYVNVTFKVAIGAKGQTNEEWEGLQTMYSNAVSHINFDGIKGTKGMRYHTLVMVIIITLTYQVTKQSLSFFFKHMALEISLCRNSLQSRG